MKIKSVTLERFRSYQKRTCIKIDDLTAFIGKNDIGKSTVLEALDIFFNGKDACRKLETNDACLLDGPEAQSPDLLICCTFTDLPEKIDLDAGNFTTLKDEYLLNEEGDLEIHLIASCKTKTPKEEFYVYASHPSVGGLEDLLSKKSTELKALVKANGLEKQCNLKVNSEMRKALWDTCKDLALKPRHVLVNAEGGKQIWEKIKQHFPVYFLFQSDRASTSDDSEAQNPLTAAIKQALKTVDNELELIKKTVREHALDVARRTVKKLTEINPELAGELRPEFKSDPSFDKLFKLDLFGDKGIPINKRGSGFRRMLLLSFFRAEAEKRREERGAPGVIYAIEEPETSQHPDHQHILFDVLKELSETEGCQVIITTHVPVLAGRLPKESLRYVRRDEGDSAVVEFGSEEVYKAIVESLGVYPDSKLLGAQGVVLVEGPQDVIFLKISAEKLKANGNVEKTFSDAKLVVVPCGGCDSLKHWETLRISEELRLASAYFTDSDRGNSNPSKYEKQKRMVEELKASGKTAVITRKNEVENYLHPDVFHRRYGTTVEITDLNDVKEAVAANAAINIPHKKLIEKLWPDMTAEEMLVSSRYHDETGVERFEIVEIIKELTSFV